jgi:hypothetical protein
MPALQTDAESSGVEAQESIRVWIESADGAIARGLVEVLSEQGAVLSLTHADSVLRGDEVTARLSLDRSSPTLATGARVLWIRSEGETFECEVEWAEGPERARLAALVTALG